MKIAVVGAGISGLTASRVLRSKGYEPVVFEKNDRPGGLVRCSLEQGNLFHHVGGIVFNTKSERVKNWFNGLFDVNNEFIIKQRNAKIWMGKRYFGYPLENHLYQLPASVRSKIYGELVYQVISKNGYSNFEEFLRRKFGNTLFELYFGPYNTKIWNFDLRSMPLPWLEGKLPMPDLREIFLNNFLKRKETGMVHSNFVYPKSGGSSFIAERIALDSDIRYKVQIERIERFHEKWLINGEAFDSVIYTGDVRKLPEILQPEFLTADVAAKLSGLTSVGISNVLCYTNDTDLTWLYLPGKETRAHRIVYTGNLSPLNNNGNRKTCMVEFSGKVEKEIINKELESLPGDLSPIAYNFEPDSYIIQLPDTRAVIRELKSELTSVHFHLTGRFAEWEYFNMDMAMLSAMKTADLFVPLTNSN